MISVAWTTTCYFSIGLSLEYYVYIIDQVRGQDGWKLAEFSFCVFIDRDEVELAWSIKDLLYGIKSTEKMIFVLVYFRELKRSPVKC